jgi:hypothetical protein
MPFTANPFDMTGSVDTTAYGLKSGDTVPTGGVDQGHTAVDTVCAAFHDVTLAADAANRVLPSQRLSFRTY